MALQHDGTELARPRGGLEPLLEIARFRGDLRFRRPPEPQVFVPLLWEQEAPRSNRGTPTKLPLMEGGESRAVV